MRRTIQTALLVSAILAAVPACAGAARSVVAYDDFDSPGYGAADYAAKWSNSYGPGELAAGGTQSFAGGRETVSAAPFKTALDFSVFDHIKYIAVSTRTFEVPKAGSVTFESTMTASTPGTVPGRTRHRHVHAVRCSLLGDAARQPAGRRRDERRRLLHGRADP
ncbi:MAG: hypothetical protein H0W96_14750 [Solirubrobacterales bacterium]|nr:hypothetical protein [Solirubrobacterales bacterium]